MKNQEAIRIIALTLAEQEGAIAPSVTHWGQARVWADLFEQRGHIKPEVEQELEDARAKIDKLTNLLNNAHNYIQKIDDGTEEGWS